ncbi:Ubiquitin carboxyl-terminal hydrolase isozyme L5 [Hordeum vulgare]|nr:Ubiquitin carboxyl-terminal hydrolase isozyme L5 [Hordeum vulgare]
MLERGQVARWVEHIPLASGLLVAAAQRLLHADNVSKIDELYSLDLDALNDLQPIYGLILLYKWRPPEKDERPVIKDAVSNVFFPNQIINSASATQAIVFVLLNSSGITLSEDLKKLKEFAKDMPPELKDWL